MPGFRVTDPARVVSVDLEAVTETKPAILGGEGDVHYVRFEVRSSTGTILRVSNQAARSLRFPNYSAGPSPIPGASAGSMTGVWGYGVTLDPSSLPPGKITIGAKVYSQKGTETTLPDVWWWNDTTSNSRYSSKKIYVNASTGNDSNPGTEELPVRTIMNGVGKVVNSPAGASSDFEARNAGGGELVCTGAFVGLGAYSALAWHSVDQWLTITATPGTTFQRAGSGNFFPSVGVSNQGVLRLRWVGWEFLALGDETAAGPEYYMGEWPSTSVQMHVWVDAFTVRPIVFNPARPWSVVYRNHNGSPIDFSGAVGGVGKSYYTCGQGLGRAVDYEFTLLQDVVIGPYMGIAMQTNQRQPGASGTNIWVRDQCYVNSDIHGLLNVAGTGLRITVPSAGQMRVEQTATLTMRGADDVPIAGDTLSIADQLVEMENHTARWLYRFRGCANPGNNGNFPVITSGYGLNGNAFVIFGNPSAVEEILGAGVSIDTVTAAGARWYDIIHTDILQYNYATVDSLFSSVVTTNVRNSQGFFSSGNALTRCALVNCGEGGGGQNPMNGSVVDCVFLHNAFKGIFFLSSGAVGCTFEENVFGNVSGSPSTTANWWRNNHFVTGPTYQS
jgi:hypothetical protein